MTAGELVGKILGEGNPDFLKGELVALLNQVMTVEVGHFVGVYPLERAEVGSPPRGRHYHEAMKKSRKPQWLSALRVGTTGFEPVTSTMST